MSRRTAAPNLARSALSGPAGRVRAALHAAIGWVVKDRRRPAQWPPFAEAPLDNEPLTDGDREAVAAALADPEPSIPWEKVKAEARRTA